jgi:hypothetical protein
MIPNLFIVGAPKCGTTAWVDYLSTHPSIAFSRAKEPHFFSSDIRGTNVAANLNEYLSLFDVTSDHSVVAEASVMYIYSKDAPKRIYALNPNARILIFLRNHIDFLKSYHNQAIFTGYETEPSLERAWQLSSERILGRHMPPDCTDPLMLNYPKLCRFANHVRNFYKVFPAEQIQVRWLDEWKSNPRQAYMDILNFLDIEDDGRNEFVKVHGAHRHRFNWLGSLTKTRPGQPPSLALRAAATTRKLLGVKRLYLGRTLRRLNTTEVKAADVTPDFRKMIEIEYAMDRSEVDEIRSTCSYRKAA